MQDLDYSGERDKTREVGKTIATERFPNTADSFWLSVSPNTVINPFDFVTVKHIFDTKTIGLVKELQAIDAAGIVAES
jgi:hypothetical protein